MLVNLVLWPTVALAYRTTAPVNACIANMKQIDGAAQQWALEYKRDANSTYYLADPQLFGFLKGSVLPVCPTGGRYVSGRRVNESPLCTVHGTLDHPQRSAKDRIQHPPRDNSLATLIVFACSIPAFVIFITSPFSPAPKNFRKPLFLVLLGLTVVTTILFVLYVCSWPNFTRGGGWMPAFILTGFCMIAGLILSFREPGWRSNFGFFCAGVAVLLTALVQKIAFH